MNAVSVLSSLRPAAGAPAEAWAARITVCWRASVEGVLEVGRLIAAAKEALEHGQFEGMIATELPFGASTARRLMAIGSDARLSDRAHVHVLPAQWGTLYELTKLDDPTFAEKIADGTICPDIERSEVTALRKLVQNKPQQKAYQDRVDAGCTVADLYALAAQGYRAGAIAADPNWEYQTWSEKGKGRAPGYDTDPLKVFASLPVQQLAADDSCMHLWCMDWLLPDAMKLIELWGFNLINVGFVWSKLNPSGNGHFMGLGHWTRNGTELCLFATRGKPKRIDAGVRQLIETAVGRHSEKPDEFYKRVAALSGGPYLELFARQMRDGWTCWGDEIPRDKFIVSEAIEITEPAPLPPSTHPTLEAVEITAPAAPAIIPLRNHPDDGELDIPAFLRRQSDNSVPVVSLSASACEPKAHNAEAEG